MPDTAPAIALDGPIEHVDPRDLSPHPDNPRDGDLGAVIESVRDNGFFSAVLVQRSTNRILVGHTRTRAAIELGMEEIPVAYVDVDDERAVRILLADNRTADKATYDDAALADLLQTLATSTGLYGTGFDGDDLDDLLASLEAPFEPEVFPDTEVTEYTDDDVAAAKDGLDSAFGEAGNQDMKSVTCPHCAGAFFVDR